MTQISLLTQAHECSRKHGSVIIFCYSLQLVLPRRPHEAPGAQQPTSNCTVNPVTRTGQGVRFTGAGKTFLRSKGSFMHGLKPLFSSLLQGSDSQCQGCQPRDVPNYSSPVEKFNRNGRICGDFQQDQQDSHTYRKKSQFLQIKTLQKINVQYLYFP